MSRNARIWKRLQAQYAGVFAVMHGEGAPQREIDAAAADLGIPFPNEYQEFLRRYGGGHIGEHAVAGLRPWETGGHSSGEWHVGFHARGYREQRYPGTERWVVFSDDGSGNPIGFDDRGQVWLSDHDTHELLCLSDSFADWVLDWALPPPVVGALMNQLGRLIEKVGPRFEPEWRPGMGRELLGETLDFEKPERHPLGRVAWPDSPIEPMGAREFSDLLHAAFDEVLVPAGFERVKRRKWVRSAKAPICEVIELADLTGGSVWPHWGFSLDYMPFPRGSLASAKLDLGHDPRRPGQDAGWVISTVGTEDETRDSARTVAARTLLEAKGYFDRVSRPQDLLSLFEERWSAPPSDLSEADRAPLAHAFTLATVGQREEALRRFEALPSDPRSDWLRRCLEALEPLAP